MYECVRDMRLYMDAVERRLDEEFREREEAFFGPRRAESSDTLIPSTHTTDSEKTQTTPAHKASETVMRFAMGETEFDEFLEPDPFLSPKPPET